MGKEIQTKIKQIATTTNLLFALTEDGRLFTTNAKTRKKWISVKVPENYKI